MCGNIKRLRFPDRPATAAEIDAAILQFVRKICDVRQPSAANQAAWDDARQAMAVSVKTMLSGLTARRASAVTKALFKPVTGKDPSEMTLLSAVLLASVCTAHNTPTRVARQTVKALIALTDAPPVYAYYGGAVNQDAETITVAVEPRFERTKDRYEVRVRTSDCRVLSAKLVLEGAPIED